MFPGSFIWKRISDDWLVSHVASLCFAAATCVIAAMTTALISNVQFQDTDPFNRFVWGVGGVLTAFSIFFLWGGMWRYWMSRDPSGKTKRKIWFVLLIVGIWYGAIAYYYFIYAPAVRKGAQEREALGGVGK